MAEAILTSWRFDPRLVSLLVLAAWLYVRGWRRLRYPVERLAAYLSGLAALFIALASPLDAFGNLLLEAHMVQHLLLIVVAPPLLLLGQPVLPFLRGLPAGFLKSGLGPFLSSRTLQKAGRFLTHPVVCWLAMAGSIVFWHMPRWYELALTSPGWHGAEHACFFYAAILFWWPVIGVRPGRAWWPRWMMIPYLVLADIVNTGLSAWLVFSTHVVYRTYEMAPRVGGISALDDQTTAGAIMWVPGSIAYLVPAFLLTMQALNGVRAEPKLYQIARQPPRERWDLLRVPVVGAMMRYRHFRRILQTVLFALAMAVAIDGFTGPQIAPLNLAGVLPWTYWRGFAVIALLAGGNFFCMACPFTLARDMGGRMLSTQQPWPRVLRSKWLAAGILIAYLWTYEIFGLWSSPWWTAWIIVGYFVTALVVDGFFQGASFCKYVCPIGQFHFVNSLVSPLEVQVRSAAVCTTCRTHDCIRGNATDRGCEMNLFQPRKQSNFDCTFCLDCVQACPEDNIGIRAVVPGKALLSERTDRADIAALAWLLTFAALVNAAGMVDAVNPILHQAHGLYLMVMLAAPLLLAWKKQTRRFGLALVPLGLSIWTSHFSYHLVTGWRSIVPVLASSTNLPVQMPRWLPTAQILLLDAGLVLSVYYAWRMGSRGVAKTLPWAMVAIAIWAASVWVLFQPMQMRGMVM